MSGVLNRKVADDEDGMRLDRWFKTHYPALRHGQLEKLLRTGQIRVDGGRARANRRLAPGETVRVPPIDARACARASAASGDKRSSAQREEARAFFAEHTLYEDDALWAINKPAGLAVQGGSKTTRHIDGMLASLERDGERPRLVHRLDRDTAGLLILAKTRLAAAQLGGAFQRREIEKTYWALVVGAPKPREGRIDMKIAPRMARMGDGDQERMTPAEGEDARIALTDFQTLEAAGAGVSFLALRPITGRKHQIRVHCAAIGAPIVGDRKYGGAGAVLDGVDAGLHLFCRSMIMRHPTTNKQLALNAPLQGTMLNTWRFFGFDPDVRVAWPTFDD